MTPAVTIGIPVYRRLEYVETVLASVDRQDHPEIDVLVSDNGQQGEALRDLVARHLSRPHRLRANARTVSITDHYNQLVEAAEGKYFMLLCDDDELGSADCVSRLVEALERHPDAGVALPRLETIDEAGTTVPRDGAGDYPPRLMSGAELVRIWCGGEYPFVNFVTNLARTAEIRDVGGYPVFPKGTSVDNALLLRLTLGREAAFVPEAVFRYRLYEASHGLALPPGELARDLKAFLDFLDTDPTLQAYAAARPGEWETVRARLVAMTWRTYRHRWKHMYRDRLGVAAWLRAAFRMPWIPEYYASVFETIAKRVYRALRRSPGD